MLGDTGTQLPVACWEPPGLPPHAVVRAGAALSGVSLILVSEKVSFSRVISTPQCWPHSTGWG